MEILDGKHSKHEWSQVQQQIKAYHDRMILYNEFLESKGLTKEWEKQFLTK